MFSTLERFKSALLPNDMLSRTDWDATLTLVGNGNQSALESYCNRRFARVIGATHTVRADTGYVSLPLYPVEQIDTLSILYSGSGTPVALADLVAFFDEASGIMDLHRAPGSHTDRVTVTYTGGYWWPATDEEDAADLPSGATPLPADILQAWLIQCHYQIEQSDLLGMAAARSDENRKHTTGLESYNLVPRVREIMQPYIRFSS